MMPTSANAFATGRTADISALSVEGWLVAGVLRAVERSSAYAEPAHWTRPVIVRWASAWSLDPHPEDAERMRARLRAARWFASAGAGAITYHKAPYDDRPRTIQCTSAHLSVLEDLARAHGIVPLRETLVILRDAYRALVETRTEPLPGWWCDYEARLAAALDGPAPVGLGIAADRLADGWPDWLDSVKAARGIASGVSGYERVVSERLLGYSKRLGDLRRAVATHLVTADPQWVDRADRSPATVLSAYGVRRVPPALDIAGPLIVVADGSTLDLTQIEGMARIPGAWAAALALAARNAEIASVTTIENETSAWSYVEERGGPVGLTTNRELVVYTSGFATTVGADALACLRAALPLANFRHWGDADAAGLQIWMDLARRSGAPLRWWRTTSAWVEAAHARGAGLPLNASERRALEQIVHRIGADQTIDPGRDALECAEALLRKNVKIEQEAFEADLDRGVNDVTEARGD